MGYYIAILLIPFVVIMILCIFGAKLVRDEAIKSNKIVIQQMSQTIDDKITNFANLLSYIQMDSEFQKVLYAVDEMDIYQRYRLAQLPQRFKGMVLADTLIEEYLIYVPEYRLAINSSGYLQFPSIDNHRFNNFFARIPNYSQVLAAEYDKEMIPIYTEKDGKLENLFYIDSLRGNLGSSNHAQFVVQLNLGELDKLIKEIELEQDGIYFTILESNTHQSLYYSDDILYQQLKNENEIAYENESFITINQANDYYCYRKASDIINADYAILISAEHIVTGTQRINFVTIISMIIIILASLLIFLIMRVREYDSIATTITMLNGNNRILNDYNAFQFIKNTVSQLLLDKKSLEDSLSSSETYLKNYFLIRLLTQEVEDHQNYTKLMEYHELEFPYSRYRVVIFYKNSKVKTEEMQDWYDELLTKIDQELKSTFQEEISTQSIYLNGMLVMIINYDFILLENEKIIENLVYYKEQLEKEAVTTVLSSRKNSYFDLNQAYDEALETLEQCLTDDIMIKEYRKPARKNCAEHLKYYQYEDNFKHALEEGNYRKAEIILKNIFEILKSTFSENTEIMRCRLYSILNNLVSVIVKNSQTTLDVEYLYRISTVKNSVEELREAIIEVLETLIDENPRVDEYDFSSQIELFVEEHYTENDLSVGKIADMFQVDLSVLSKRFKKERHVNISDYIQMVRIKQAKGLLLDKRNTIKQVALECGYLNSDVFIRVFKRYEGITPGKFRSSKV